MLHTLALTGCVTRADDATNAIYELMDLSITTQVNEQVSNIADIAGNGNLVVAFGPVTTGKWLALRVITENRDVRVTINGANTTFLTRHLALDHSNITSLRLDNPHATESISVQFILGGV